MGSKKALSVGTLVVSVLTAIIISLSVARPASAGGVGAWSDVTGPTGTNLTQVAPARAADGSLWLVYVRAAAAKTDLLVRPLTAAGVSGAPVAVQAGWDFINQPTLVTPLGGGLRAFFSGQRAGAGGGYSGLTYATSADGTTWTLAPGDIDYKADGSSAWAGDVSAAVAPSGTAFQTWWGSNGVWVHRDHAAAPGAQYEYSNGQLGGGFGYYSNLAADADGTVWLAWAANVTGKQGVWVQQVSPANAAPVAVPGELPGSSTHYNGADSFSMMLSRVPMAARPGAGGGVYVAYPTGYPTTKVVRLWRLGAGGVIVAGGSAAKPHAAVAADPGGRLWVVWSERRSGGRPIIKARRSDPTATVFGATVSLLVPKGKDTVWHLAAAAQAGRLDVLAHLGPADATWHSQLLPGLSAMVSPKVIKVGKKVTVTVTVKDAGQAVAGAKVKFGGKSAKTNAAGKAKLKLGPYAAPKTLKGTAKLAGYVSAALSVKVKK